MKHLLALVLLAALAACQPDPPTVRQTVSAAERAAQRQQAHAQHLDSLAAHYRAMAQASEDSAIFYHLQSTHVQISNPGDTAALRRFFADYPR